MGMAGVVELQSPHNITETQHIYADCGHLTEACMDEILAGHDGPEERRKRKGVEFHTEWLSLHSGEKERRNGKRGKKGAACTEVYGGKHSSYVLLRMLTSVKVIVVYENHHPLMRVPNANQGLSSRNIVVQSKAPLMA